MTSRNGKAKRHPRESGDPRKVPREYAMRIVVHGQEAFGKAVLEKLLERKENVVAVFCAPDKAGRAEDPLKLFAKEKGLAVHQPKSWKTPEALELMKSCNADLCVMAYVTLFVPQ